MWCRTDTTGRNTGHNPPGQNFKSSIVVGGFVIVSGDFVRGILSRGLCPGGLCLGRFCPFPSVALPDHIINIHPTFVKYDGTLLRLHKADEDSGLLAENYRDKSTGEKK